MDGFEYFTEKYGTNMWITEKTEWIEVEELSEKADREGLTKEDCREIMELAIEEENAAVATLAALAMLLSGTDEEEGL